MDPFAKTYDTVSRSPVGAILFTLLSISANVIGLLGFFGVDSKSRTFWLVLMVVSFMVTGVIIALALSAIVRVYTENKAIRQVFDKLHEIAHYHRNDLCYRIINQASLDSRQVLRHEKTILTEMCGCVAQLFTALVKVNCHACVTLTQQEQDEDGEKNTCFIWASSIMDTHPPIVSLDIAKDIRFSEAIKPRPNGPSHFFVADLNRLQAETEKAAKNAAKNGEPGNDRVVTPIGWESRYVSCLVIPLRVPAFNGESAIALSEPKEDAAHRPHENPKASPPQPRELILSSPQSTVGFLKLETKSANRLNDKYHKYLLAACADIFASQLALRHLHEFSPVKQTTG